MFLGYWIIHTTFIVIGNQFYIFNPDIFGCGSLLHLDVGLFWTKSSRGRSLLAGNWLDMLVYDWISGSSPHKSREENLSKNYANVGRRTRNSSVLSWARFRRRRRFACYENTLRAPAVPCVSRVPFFVRAASFYPNHKRKFSWTFLALFHLLDSGRYLWLISLLCREEPVQLKIFQHTSLVLVVTNHHDNCGLWRHHADNIVWKTCGGSVRTKWRPDDGIARVSGGQ